METDGTLAALPRITLRAVEDETMEFFAKATTVVMAVLASLFADVEPTRAKASPAVDTKVGYAATAAFEVDCTQKLKPQGTLVVVLRSVPAPQATDSESQRFLEWIGRAQPGPKPLAVTPWFAQTDVFRTPSVGETAGIIRALMDRQSDD